MQSVLFRSLSMEFSASHPNAWDYALPAERETEWKEWCHSLRALEDIKVPCSYGTEALFHSHGTAYLLWYLRDGNQCSIIPKNCPWHQPGWSSICAQKSQVDTSPCHNNTLLRILLSHSGGWDKRACARRTRTEIRLSDLLLGQPSCFGLHHKWIPPILCLHQQPCAIWNLQI